MAGIRITQLRPQHATGRRYGSFAGRTPAAVTSTGGGGLAGGYRHYFPKPQEKRPRARPEYRPEPIYGECSITVRRAKIAGRGQVDNSLPELVLDEDEMFAGLLAAIG